MHNIDNLYYPSWMEGEWKATQTLRKATTPLGLKYVGGPAGSVDIASASMREQLLQVNVPVSFRLKWVKTKFGVAEDRLFNSRQRLDGFAGRTVVSSVEYNNVGGSNRVSILALGGGENDPLQTTTVRFKGPAAQKTFVVSHGEDKDFATTADTTATITATTTKDRVWSGYELLRNIFALTNTNTAPPVTTDTELIWKFEKIDETNVKGQLRIASYLNAQSDSLYFDARYRAVSFSDYEIKLEKISL